MQFSFGGCALKIKDEFIKISVISGGPPSEAVMTFSVGSGECSAGIAGPGTSWKHSKGLCCSLLPLSSWEAERQKGVNWKGSRLCRLFQSK